MKNQFIVLEKTVAEAKKLRNFWGDMSLLIKTVPFVPILCDC